MATRVQYDIPCAQKLSSLHRPRQQGHRFLPDCLIGGGKIDQIGSVQHNRIEIVQPCSLGKCGLGYWIGCRRSPRSGVAGKDLYRITANPSSRLHRFDGPGVCGHVATKAHQELSLPSDSIEAYVTSSAVCRLIPGNSSSFVRPNCCKNSEVVAKRAGRPTV